jgi:hypothetical protein
MRNICLFPLRVWTGFIWLRIGLVAGFCELCSEPSGFIIGGEFLYQLGILQLLKEDSDQ